jgi:DNA replication licensing factor MCM7
LSNPRRAGLLTSTYLEVMHVTQAKAGYADLTITQDQIDAINALGARGNVFERLAASIAPEIYGMREVKKALLLQMVGGVTRSFPDGMKLRGDIHICLMGDPGACGPLAWPGLARPTLACKAWAPLGRCLGPAPPAVRL